MQASMGGDCNTKTFTLNMLKFLSYMYILFENIKTDKMNKNICICFKSPFKFSVMKQELSALKISKLDVFTF